MAILDRDADGKITIYDLEELSIRNLGNNEKKLNQNKLVEERLKVARRLFQKFDTNNKGYLYIL